MIFNSLQYAIFLPVIFILYWAIKSNKVRNFVLLIASYYFYMSWNYKLVVLILTTTAVSFIAARLIEKKKSIKLILFGSVSICLGILAFFKYANFALQSVTYLLRAISLPMNDIGLKLILPVGISFYTFQTLSYVIDVYKGRIKAESNFFTYALYVSFFPQLVAGPIERPENLLPQFKQKHTFNYRQAVYGAKQIAIGAFKKVVVADTLALYVDKIYNDVHNYNGFVLVLATLFFTFQIYCDFSGYTDIALGSAKLLGFELMDNFKVPYMAKNIKEFWARWHISLSSWFKDYVYIPLGGSRVSKPRHYFNLFATFLLSGLWHGANWTFVIWGGYHGALNVLQTICSKVNLKFKIPTWIQIGFTFCLVNLGWVLFRANSVSDIFYIVPAALYGVFSPFDYIYNGLVSLNLLTPNALFAIIPLGVLIVLDILANKIDIIEASSKLAAPIKYPLYFVFTYVPIGWFIYYLFSGVEQAFLYFQF